MVVVIDDGGGDDGDDDDMHSLLEKPMEFVAPFQAALKTYILQLDDLPMKAPEV